MIKMPDYYQKLRKMPEDPPSALIYGTASNNFQCIVKVFDIEREMAMPLNEKEIIDGIHSCLDASQGLIEVKQGVTPKGDNYIYSIIKNKFEPSGVQYFLRMHLFQNDNLVEIDSFADEIGVTGMRDSMIFAKLGIENKDNWFRDPYNKNIKSGFLMNISEESQFDSIFPDHPLSEIRRLINFIIKN